MGSPPDLLLRQRLLLAGLVALAALSAVLLWLLRASAERGERRASAPAGAAAERTAALATIPATEEEAPHAAVQARKEERTALPTTPAPSDELEDEAFDPAAVTGRVLCSGLPVPDAEILLFDGTLDRRERKQPLATTKSDARGRFRLRGQEPHVRYTLFAQHPDHLPSDETFFAGHDQEVELERAANVGGTVRSRATQQPIAGVEVALERWHHAPEGMRQRVSTTSDDQGRWQLSWAEPGIETFEVLRPGFLPELHEFQVAEEGGTGFDIQLQDGRALELELYALETGALLVDAELDSNGRRVRTDARGRLGLPLPSASADSAVRVSLGLEGGCLTLGRVEVDALLAAGGVLRVPLARGGNVRGRVLAGDGGPVSGAELRLSGGGRAPPGILLPAGFLLSAPRSPARSGADGSFELAGLPPREGLVELRARHPDHPQGRSEKFAFAQLGMTVEQELRLERGATIAGTVQLDGQPAGLRVLWSGERASGWTRANDRGDYRISGVPSGEVRLGARLDEEDLDADDSERPEDLLLFVEEGASLRADLALVSRIAHIRGSVVDTLGEPVAEAYVFALLREEGRDEEVHAQSEADGTFDLTVPETPGLLFDVFAIRGPRRAQLESVGAGREIELVMPALASATLRVVDALRHEPVQGFQLYWRESEEGEFERLELGGRSLFAGPDGSFEAELPAGRLDLVVSARDQGYVPARQEGVNLLGAPPLVEFELERGVGLELVLEVAPEAPPEVVAALQQLRRGRTSIASEEQWADRERGGDYFRQEVRNAQALRPDADGVLRLEALPSGRYRFFNGPKGLVFRPQEFELPPVAEHRVKVTLEGEKRNKQKSGG